MARFQCSTGPIETGNGTSADAALPFLSASAGLILASGLLQLQAGLISNASENQWTLWVATQNRTWQSSRRRCRGDCRSAMPIEALRVIDKESRWRTLLD